MTRKPRKQTDHLVTARLLTHSYGQMGEIATAGGFFTYFVIMECYGFPVNNLFSLLSLNVINPGSYNSAGVFITDTSINNGYTYNPSLLSFTPASGNNPSTMFGSPNIPQFCSQAIISRNFPDWLSPINTNMDLRGFYYNCCPITSDNPGGYCSILNWPS
jgi:hypothetical protein